jgi:hypothetical protein
VGKVLGTTAVGQWGPVEVTPLDLEGIAPVWSPTTHYFPGNLARGSDGHIYTSDIEQTGGTAPSMSNLNTWTVVDGATLAPRVQGATDAVLSIFGTPSMPSWWEPQAYRPGTAVRYKTPDGYYHIYVAEAAVSAADVPGVSDLWASLSLSDLRLELFHTFSALSLDSLTDVVAPADTPVGKVLGTTGVGEWGPVDAPSGLPGGSTFSSEWRWNTDQGSTSSGAVAVDSLTAPTTISFSNFDSAGFGTRRDDELSAIPAGTVITVGPATFTVGAPTESGSSWVFPVTAHTGALSTLTGSLPVSWPVAAPDGSVLTLTGGAPAWAPVPPELPEYIGDGNTVGRALIVEGPDTLGWANHPYMPMSHFVPVHNPANPNPYPKGFVVVAANGYDYYVALTDVDPSVPLTNATMWARVTGDSLAQMAGTGAGDGGGIDLTNSQVYEWTPDFAMYFESPGILHYDGAW